METAVRRNLSGTACAGMCGRDGFLTRYFQKIIVTTRARLGVDIGGHQYRNVRYVLPDNRNREILLCLSGDRACQGSDLFTVLCTMIELLSRLKAVSILVKSEVFVCSLSPFFAFIGMVMVMRKRIGTIS